MHCLHASILVNWRSISLSLTVPAFWVSFTITFFYFFGACLDYFIYSSIAYLRSTGCERAFTNWRQSLKVSTDKAELSISFLYLKIMLEGYWVPKRSFLAFIVSQQMNPGSFSRISQIEMKYFIIRIRISRLRISRQTRRDHDFNKNRKLARHTYICWHVSTIYIHSLVMHSRKLT